jgi:death-on-curing family protein
MDWNLTFQFSKDIVNMNKKYSNGNQMNNNVDNILNSASYYNDPYEQVAAVTRSITDHVFENGNKRTAFDTLNMLLDDLGLKNLLSDAQKWNLIYDIAEGRLNDVTEIANIIKGK